MIHKLQKILRHHLGFCFFVVQLTAAAMIMSGTMVIFNMITGSHTMWSGALIFLLIGPGLLAYWEKSRILTLITAALILILIPLGIVVLAFWNPINSMIWLNPILLWILILSAAVTLWCWNFLLILVLTLKEVKRKFYIKNRIWSPWVTVLMILTLPVWLIFYRIENEKYSLMRNLKIYHITLAVRDAVTGNLVHDAGIGVSPIEEMDNSSIVLCNQWTSLPASPEKGILHTIFRVTTAPLRVKINANNYVDTEILLPPSPNHQTHHIYLTPAL